jgi:hypothetical protein
MIDLAMAKSVVDLFKELLGFLDRKNQNRRDVFNNAYKPLYERLDAVVKEYYAAMREVLKHLEENEPDLRGAIRELEDRRASLVLARDGILGEASAFFEHRRSRAEFSTALIGAGKELEAKSLAFAESILIYFRAPQAGRRFMRSFMPTLPNMSEEQIETMVNEFRWKGGSVSHPVRSMMTTLIDRLKLFERSRLFLSEDQRHMDLHVIRRDVSEMIAALEANWRDVGQSYAELKLYCQA